MRSPAPVRPPVSPRYAPSPRPAHHRVPSAGADTTPTSMPPSRSTAISVAQTGDAAHEVMRPVDRVDDPARLGVSAPGVALLLAQHGVIRVRLGDALAQQRLDLEVPGRDK